ncbi:MAG: nitroreductase family protein [Muribaculaceae bacterium]|nr:nitroreductase family protein [Muribaculaceae bacterium]
MRNTDLYPQLMQLLRERYSCRAYKSEPVDRDTLTAVLDAARLAPSATNRQPWVFLAVDSPEGLEAIRKSYPREWIKTAPVCVIAFGDHKAAWHRPSDGKDHTDVDLSIAVEHICLAATSLGLGSCWVCNFDPSVLRDAFEVPSSLEPIAIIPLGHPAADSVPEKSRKKAEDIIRFNSL